MTKHKDTPLKKDIKALLLDEPDFLKSCIQQSLQEILEAEIAETLGAGKYERSDQRAGQRAGYYPRSLVTRVGKIELRIPRDRQGHFSTQLFERYQRSEKALVSALTQMYIEGVSTRKIKAITEELCGYEFSAGQISQINRGLDKQLLAFAKRPIDDSFAYLILDARYEKVRIDHVVQSQAVLIAIGIDGEGKRHVLGVELAPRESRSSWKDFLLSLKERGLSSLDFIVSDDHSGLKKSICEVYPQAIWQRCYVHFLRNALDHFPKKGDSECLQELRWIYDRKDRSEAKRALDAWLLKWEERYGGFCDWVEESIEETLSFYSLPRGHHRHLKSTNMLERFNEEIKRRTRVVRIFPSKESCLRLVRALCSEQHEAWIEDKRYVNMESYEEHKRKVKEDLRQAA